MRGETRRVLLRHHLYLPPWEKVRVVFIVYGPNDVRAVLECLTCEVPMEWNEGCQYWLCPDCEYELTPGEARDLQDSMQNALNELFGTRRSWLWDLVLWFEARWVAVRAKRLPPPT